MEEGRLPRVGEGHRLVESSRSRDVLVTNPDDPGRAHPVSVAVWATRDPATRILFPFSYHQRDVPFGLRGSTYPPDPLSGLV